MPPKKRAAAKAAAAIVAPAASARPKRGAASVSEPTSEPQTKRSKTAPAPTKRGRGRPPKGKSAKQVEEEEEEEEDEDTDAEAGEAAAEEEVAEVPTKRGRGRPAKGKSATQAAPAAAKTKTSGRGRGGKLADPGEQLQDEADHAEAEEEAEEAAALPKRRGRPAKAKGAASKPDAAPPPAAGKKRGRPASKKEEPDAQEDEEEAPVRGKRAKTTKAEEIKVPVKGRGGRGKASAAPAKDDEEAPVPPKGRGRGHSKKNPEVAEPAAGAKEKKTAEQSVTDEHGRSFWLMKAEPESRIEKGKDVKFSIDDLAACTVPEPWSGVRNPVARNNMKAMKLGDLAFFYHSNCKTPGVAGIMEIVQEAAPDESAFDEADPYYDAKSDRNNPKWYCVHVEFRQKLPNYVGLQELKQYKDGELKDMALLKQSRLSVSKVSKSEWDFIIDLAGAKAVLPKPSLNIEDDAETSKPSGLIAKAKNLFKTSKPARATSVGPSLRTPASTSQRASSAQPSFDVTPAQSTTLASVAEDAITGAVPPAFVMRSSPPIAPVDDDATRAGPSSSSDAVATNGLANGLNGTLAGAIVDTVNDVIGTVAEATMGAAPEPKTPIEEVMKMNQLDMETTIM